MALAQQQRVTIERVGWKYGLLLAAANIGYFLIMALFGLEDVTWLRVGNFIIMFAILYTSIRSYKHKKLERFTYLKGMGEGMYTVLVGYIPFAIFIFIYARWIRPEFTTTLKELPPLGEAFTPFFIGFITLLEGLIYGLIFTFTLMQRLKIAHYKSPTRK